MRKAMVFSVLAIALGVGAPAFAGTSEQVEICVAALDEGGEVNAGDYEARFKSVRGGGLKRLSLELKPLDGAGETLEAECKIRRGEVVEVVLKA